MRGVILRFQEMGGKNSTLTDIIKILYVGSCSELIPDIEKFSTSRHKSIQDVEIEQC
jgi:hypothetical protein